MDIKLIRLLSGEELLAVIADVGSDNIVAKDAVLVQSIPDELNQNIRVAFVPFMPFSKDDDYTISKAVIVCMADPVDEMVEQYKRSTSQIVTPDNKLVVPN